MRQNTEGELDNSRSIIEEYTVNKNNMLKLKDALLNIDIERGNSFKLSTSNEEENIEENDLNKKEENNKSPDEPSNENNDNTKEELISTDYMYDDDPLEQDETLLDGWERETPLALIGNKEKFERMNLLYDFISH